MVRVWDLPTRVFHWMLVALIAFSWWSAENDELDLHIWSGLAVLTLLIFRLLWGVFGSSTARFANFVRGPRAMLGYLRNSRAWTAIGHNPIGAASVIAMLLVLIGLHVAAILFYRVALGKKLTWPMITGRSALNPKAEPMRPGKWWAALLCLAVALAVTRWIIAGAPPFGS